MQPIRVLLIDDQDFLGSAANWLSSQPHILPVRIVWAAAPGEEAIEQVSRLRPDLVLMDGADHRAGVLESTRRIKQQPDPPRIVLFNAVDCPEFRHAAEGAGADAFFCKASFRTDLMPRLQAFFTTQ